MRYAALIYADESTDVAPGEPGWDQLMEEYEAFGVHAGDKIAGGEALHATTTATTVRVRDGEVITSDGPFAETKEQLGGFYLLDCDDLDQAVAMAARIPGAKTGCVEVRPCIDFAG